MLGPAELLLITLVFAIPVLLSVYAFRLARRRGREPWIWALSTLVFPPSALLLAMLSPEGDAT